MARLPATTPKPTVPIEPESQRQQAPASLTSPSFVPVSSAPFPSTNVPAVSDASAAPTAEVPAPASASFFARASASASSAPSVSQPPIHPLGEKQEGRWSTSAPMPPAPPAYSQAPVLGTATALYAYNGPDAGDLALLVNDRISVLEYMNPDWWKGRNERTGLEGIFPSNYVQMVDEKNHIVPMTAPATPDQAVTTAPTGQVGAGPEGKVQTQGKKFGKKLGNAAIFGAVGYPFFLFIFFALDGGPRTDLSVRAQLLVPRLSMQSSRLLI